MTEIYQMLGQVGHYRLSVSVSVFGRKSRFTFGGTYGFGRICYVTFGLLSVSAENKTSAFGRPLQLLRSYERSYHIIYSTTRNVEDNKRLKI